MKFRKDSLTMIVITMFALALASPALADSGFFVGASLGKGYIDENIDGFRFKADSTAFRVAAGYDFNENIGVEAAYLNLGEFKDSIDVEGTSIPVSAEADGFSVAAVGSIPLSESIAVQGRVGMYFWDSQSTVAGVTESDPSDQGPFVGLGLAYAMSESVQFDIGAEYYDMDEVEPLLATVGVTFRF